MGRKRRTLPRPCAAPNPPQLSVICGSFQCPFLVMGLFQAGLIHGRCAPLDCTGCNIAAEQLPESRDVVADYRGVGTGAHRCRARQAEQWTDLAEVVTGFGDPEQCLPAARSLTKHLPF